MHLYWLSLKATTYPLYPPKMKAVESCFAVEAVILWWGIVTQDPEVSTCYSLLYLSTAVNRDLYTILLASAYYKFVYLEPAHCLSFIKGIMEESFTRVLRRVVNSESFQRGDRCGF